MIDYILWDHLPLLYWTVYVVYISHVAVMLYLSRLYKNACYTVSTIHAHAHVPQRTKKSNVSCGAVAAQTTYTVIIHYYKYMYIHMVSGQLMRSMHQHNTHTHTHKFKNFMFAKGYIYTPLFNAFL